MPRFLNSRAVLLPLCFAGQLVCTAETENGPEVEAAKKFQAYAKEAAAAYAIKVRSAVGDERKTVLRDEPILRWTNPLGGRRAHGEVFLFTHDDRPAAALSLYEFTEADGVLHEHHEFCSLAAGPIATSGPDMRDWSPMEPGLTLKAVPAAPAPAASQRQRLRQMRELAGRFTARKTTRLRETRALRVLPQPVHRYVSKLHHVSDGALFALVEATDPEVFLLLEAHNLDGKPQWEYGLARMTSLPLSVSLDDKEIWHADGLPARETYNRKDKPYTAFMIK